MAYSTTTKVRKLTGLTTDDITDSDLSDVIDLADKRIKRNINVQIQDEKLTEDSDHDDVVWVKHTPIADTDFDSVVDSNDITIYTWTDETDEATKSEITVSSIDSETGRIILSSDISSDVEKVTGDYSYYLGNTPDWDLMGLASTYLSAYLSLVKIKGHLPPKYSIGKLRITEELPGKVYLDEYRKVLREIKEDMFVS